MKEEFLERFLDILEQEVDNMRADNAIAMLTVKANGRRLADMSMGLMAIREDMQKSKKISVIYLPDLRAHVVS